MRAVDVRCWCTYIRTDIVKRISCFHFTSVPRIPIHHVPVHHNSPVNSQGEFYSWNFTPSSEQARRHRRVSALRKLHRAEGSFRTRPRRRTGPATFFVQVVGLI